VDIEGYKFYRKDRGVIRRGGVGMYVNDFLPNRRALEFEFPEIELLWVEIELGIKKIIIGACYRPPGQSADEISLFMSRLQDSIGLVLHRNPESILLLGDFNDPCSVWESDHNSSDLKLKLYDFINVNDLHQIVEEPTHISSTAANILDLIITDSPGYIVKQSLMPPIGSKHQIVQAELKIQYRRDKDYLREVWSYNRGDYNGLVRELKNTPWHIGPELYEEIDDMAEYWHKSFMEACKIHVPNRFIKVRPRDKPWITHQVKDAIRKRNRMYKRFKRTRSLEHELIWKQTAREANYYMNLAKAEHITKIKSMLMDLRVGEKKYWKIAKEVYGSKKTIGIPALKVGNKSISTSLEKAQCFNKFFAEQQTLPPLRFNQQLPPIIFLTESRFEFIQTSEQEVLKILKSLDIGKANGPDGISSKLLKESSEAIALPLSKLFNKSFELTKVPACWKEANVCPIFKKEDKSLVSNYRPISLLSCLGKIQERIVFIHLYKYLIKNDLLTWKNSGFRELDSAVNQLLYITDKIHKAIEAGKEICLVFLDVSKAFDRVWHSGLLHKARCMGIEGRIFDWLCDYLKDRRIRVVINGQKSEWLATNAGVPQGSILGPLLFLIFINDITNGIECDIHLFADDTSLMEIIENYNESYDKVNRDLNRLSIWADNWLITFNAAKTVYLKITRKVNQAPKPVLKLKGVNVKEVTNHKHLGLTFNETLTWTDHIANLASKAAKCVGLLRRICREVPRDCLETLYKSMIRPILEYGDIIFDGSADSSLKRLEYVQRQAGITCTGAYKHTKHQNLLEELGWPPLSLRRKHHRLNIMFKLQRGLAPIYLKSRCPPLTMDRTNYNLRSGVNVTMPQVRTTTYQKSFFPQTINDWNELGRTTREVRSLSTFKEKIKLTAGYELNSLYQKSNGKAAVNQTRMRLGLSGLSSQRYDYNHIKDPKCQSCNSKTEDPVHFFLLCPTHTIHRGVFLEGICDILRGKGIKVDFNKSRFRKLLIDIILKGSKTLTEDENKQIFLKTQMYIKNTKRFV
jgi:hypothetical protein